MIGIELSEENFEYDIYSLIKAFYPEEEITRFYDPDKTFLVVQIEYLYGKEEDDIEEIRISLKEKKCTLIPYSIHTAKKTRSQKKNLLKKVLYKLLSEKTKKELPWGTLTGIRPTKLPFAMLEEGKTQEEIEEEMRQTYLASEKKIRLSIEIAKREREILKELDYKNGYSLYVAIPFCPSRCLYCSFPSYSYKEWEKRAGEYVNALLKEIFFVSEIMGQKKLNTLYIGGGTPTTLEPWELEKLLKALTTSFDLSHCLEFTVEAGRPDSVTEEKLMVLKKYGVTRISVNPQTMKQETLDLIGRKHTIEQTREAFFLARRCGFSNINMDLISGLPGETKEDMEHTMSELRKLRPDSITVHSLALKRASRLKELQEQYKDYIRMNDSAIADKLEEYAREMGLVPYYLYRQKNMVGNLENVGYSTLDKAGIYNILIMEEKQSIIAVGAGAITKIVSGNRIDRIENVKNVEQYLERIEEMIERKRIRFQRE